MSTGFSFGSSTLGSSNVAAGGSGTGGGFSFGTGTSRQARERLLPGWAGGQAASGAGA